MTEEEYQEEAYEEQATEEVEQEEHQEEESPQERNWREMRESLKELKKTNEQLQQELRQKNQQEQYMQQMQMQAYQQQGYQQQMPPQQQEPDPEEEYDEDDYLNVKGFKQLGSKLVKNEVEKYIKQYEMTKEQEEFYKKYPDFHQVVTPENINKLCAEDPETAADIDYLKDDPIRMNRQLYKELKNRYAKTQEDSMPKPKGQQQDKEKPPVSSSAVPKRSALSEANAFAQGLTPDLKEQLWKEMQEAEKYR